MSDFTTVYFKCLEKTFEIPSVLAEFTLFGNEISIKFYGAIIAFGFTLAVLFGGRMAYKWKMSLDKMIDVLIYGTVAAIIGARLYYVLFQHNNIETFWDVFNIRDGGLAIYGGIIVGASMALIVLHIKKMHIPAFLDTMAPAVMLAQAIGRWGNFMNVEAYGSETTLPWRMGIQKMGQWIYVHPTFLYESLWNLLGFALIMIFYKKRKFDGQVTLAYFAWYGLGRMMIEGLRTDSLYLGSSNIRVSQLLAGILFVLATAALVFFMIRIKGKKMVTVVYRKEAKNYQKALEVIAQNEKKAAERKAAKEAKKEEKRKEKEATIQNK